MPKGASGRSVENAGTTAFIWTACLAFTLFVLTRPYRGINGDALIYVTRELARRDPRGLGQDAMFLADTQTGYTIFTPLLSALLDVMPHAIAAMMLAIGALTLWFAAAAFLARVVASLLSSQLPSDTNRTTFAMLVFVATGPLSYVAFDVLSAAEAMAVPRPYAEACVLTALAFLLRNRIAVATACGVLALLFHPIMGLAGFGVGFIYLALQRPRLWWLAPAALAALGAAAVAGLPLAVDLLAPLDQDWRSLLDRRTAYLFPSLWPTAHWSGLSVQAATLLITARLVTGPVKRLFLSALLASFAGLALAVAWSDLWPSLLIVQIQPWRVVWIAAVLAPLALALAALKLWHKGTPERASLAFLALGWICRDAWTIVVPALAASWFLLNESERLRPHMSRIWTPILFAFVAIAALAWVGLPLEALWRSTRHAGAGFEFERAYLWSVHPLALPAGVVAIWMALAPKRWTALVVIVPTLVLGTLAFFWFDDRTRLQKAFESGRAPEGLVAALPASGEVLWIGGGKETWYWAGRANWAAAIQGSSLVFSRAFALRWGERAEALVALGLETPKLLRPWTFQQDSLRDPATQAAPAQHALDAVCARADAPVAIVTPLSEGDLAGSGAIEVESPHPAFTLQTSARGLEWRRTTRYAVRSCADAARPAH